MQTSKFVAVAGLLLLEFGTFVGHAEEISLPEPSGIQLMRGELSSVDEARKNAAYCVFAAEQVVHSSESAKVIKFYEGLRSRLQGSPFKETAEGAEFVLLAQDLKARGADGLIQMMFRDTVETCGEQDRQTEFLAFAQTFEAATSEDPS